MKSQIMGFPGSTRVRIRRICLALDALIVEKDRELMDAEYVGSRTTLDETDIERGDRKSSRKIKI
jgi:hypothetical protein